ncbi:MAG: CooT family nickel-binding protein [Ardenticatenaceae bacterium]|nr:CooT family nickel-binding protein [Ardenticatenaceae bacterium]
MCQVAVYLDEEKIMDSVMLVEPIPEGVRLVKLFEPPLVVTAVIRQIDLMKNKLYLESTKPQTEVDDG